MQRILKLGIGALAICVFGSIGAGANTQDAVARGRATFVRAGCYQCHGYEAQGGSGSGPRIGPDPLPIEGFTAVVRGSRGEMPAFSDRVVSEAELKDIYAFLSALPRPKSVDSIAALKDLKDPATAQPSK